jgi:NADH-quinone oxidoreductase subunit N
VAGTAALALAKLLAALSGASAAWSLWVAVLAAFTMVVGGLRAAAAGGSLRTLTGWLVVNQVGWVAAGLSTHDRLGTAAALFLTGALVIAGAASPPLAGSAESGAAAVAGLGRREPARAAALALVLLSLAGAPPLAGFFGEFTVAAELVRSGLGWVLACGLLGSLLATVGVVRALRLVYVEPGFDEVRPSGPRQPPLWAPEALLPAALVLAYGLFANPIHSLAAQGAAALGLG